MDKQIRIISVVCVILIIALMVSTTIMQFINSSNILKSDFNTRQIYDQFGKNRGSILVQDGEGEKVIAHSEPVHDYFRYQRIFTDSESYAPITGFYSIANLADRGIESALNDQLNGSSDSFALNNFVDSILGKDQRGGDVHLTVDARLQEASYAALKSSGFNGAVVALNPTNGDILALSSYPTVDYNEFATHDTAVASSAYQRAAADDNQPMINRGTDEIYPPGSTFKIVDVASLLKTGKYHADTVVDAPLNYTLPGTEVNLPNYNGWKCGAVNGKESIRTAFAFSCNTPFAKLANEIGADAQNATANDFGFNRKYDLVTNQSFSNGDGTNTLRSDVSQFISAPAKYPANLSADRLALAAIGQGDVAATPLQICLLSAIIANSGKEVSPHIVKKITDENGSQIGNLFSFFGGFSSDNTGSKQIIDSEISKEMTDMMTYNVTSGVARDAWVAGVQVAGKTGTAENDPEKPSHLWFTGFAPAGSPQIAICVFLQNGGVASASAAKVASTILTKYFGGK